MKKKVGEGRGGGEVKKKVGEERGGGRGGGGEERGGEGEVKKKVSSLAVFACAEGETEDDAQHVM